MILYRSLLFVPGGREEMLEKAGGLPADSWGALLEGNLPRRRVYPIKLIPWGRGVHEPRHRRSDPPTAPGCGSPGPWR